MESSRNTNYWPGFVDALTNTVIAMVFLVIVLTIALSAFVSLVVKQRTEKLVQDRLGTITATKPVVSPEKSPEPSVPNSVPAAARSLLQGEVVVQSAPVKKPDAASLAADSGGTALVLRYSSAAVDLDEKSVRALDTITQRAGLQMSRMYAELVVRGPEIFLSENQRSGFFRAMSARNYLMKKGMPPANITIRFEDDPGTKDNSVVIAISATAKGDRP